jgi:ABC-type transport system involved in multi-copper enzyme maturation permease subunit
MIFLPIVDRELRVASRQRATYMTRFGSVLAGVAVGGWIMLMPWMRTPQKLGMALFIALSLITFIYSLMVGIRTTADCISEEKREGTLGLLFLTDLKGFDIVFGKMAATSLNSFYGMLAIFPIMAISLLAGGVSGAEFWRVTLTAINNVFFSLSVGMFCSAISRDERKAMAAAFGILFLLCIGLPLTGGLIADARNAIANPLFFIPSPGFACFMAFDETARQTTRYWPNYFYTSLITVHLLGWIFLSLSCWIVPRTWHDKVEDSSKRSVRIMRWLFAGSAAARLKLRRTLLELNPFFWLTSRDRSKTLLVWLLLIAGAMLWAWGLWKYPSVWKEESAFIFSAMVTHGVLKIWLATEATRQLGLDRRSGALELLLSTPITVRQILRGQLLSLWKQFGPASGVVILVDVIFFSSESGVSWTLFWLTIIGVYVLDMITLSWVGMWLGLAHKHPSRAAASAVARVMALPWAIFLAIMTCFALMFHFAGGPPPRWADEDASIILGAVIGVTVDIFLLSWARKRLLLNLRETAAHRFDVRPSEPEPTRVPAPVPQSV